MDILISSNLERLIYRIAGDDSEKNAKLMAELAKNGSYTITEEMQEAMKDFARRICDRSADCTGNPYRLREEWIRA